MTQWLKFDWKHDLPSGLVVYLVALPLCLGIGLASTGRPDLMFSGIIAGIVGGIVVGALSGSAMGVSGPAAGLVVIVLGAISSLGTFDRFLLAVVLAGALQVVAGMLRAGVIGYYFPSAVIKGMLAAIGLILIMKEIPHALGYDKDFMGDEAFDQTDKHNTITELWFAFKYHSIGAVIISAFSLVVLILFDRPFVQKIKALKLIPGALVVVVFGTLINEIFLRFAPHLAMTGEHLVQLPVAQSMTDFGGFLRLPDFGGIVDHRVWTVALTLAVVASLESLLSVEATDKLDPQRRNTDTNRELLAQGAGNIVSGLLGGLPVTQVIVRSSANINAGGRTKMAAIVHGFILLISALAFPALLNHIPLAALACILLMVGYKLSKVGLYQSMFKLGWDQFLPFIITIIAILFTDLLKGIGIGMVVAFYFIIFRNYKYSFNQVHEKGPNGTHQVVIRLSENVTFLNKGSIQKALDDLPKNCYVVIDGTASQNIDYDVLEAIDSFKRFNAAARGIAVETIGLPTFLSAGGH